jgi:hypothetical protein
MVIICLFYQVLYGFLDCNILSYHMVLSVYVAISLVLKMPSKFLAFYEARKSITVVKGPWFLTLP